jgi:hypothetical protein
VLRRAAKWQSLPQWIPGTACVGGGASPVSRPSQPYVAVAMRREALRIFKLCFVEEGMNLFKCFKD